MQKEANSSPEVLSAEVLESMRSLIAAVRAVKLYPPNNPVYSQSVKKAYEALSSSLKTSPTYRLGVEKTFFTYEDAPVGKETQVNKPIAQDLFLKGIREITFTEGLGEQELLILLRGLALSSEELGLKSGITSILWENDATHIKVLEAALGEVITAQAALEQKPNAASLSESATLKKMRAAGSTLVVSDFLNDLLTDPEAFGAGMVELAEKTRGENESMQERLYTLYQDAGRAIREKHPEQSEAMFENLAKSALSLDPKLRDGLVGEQLYGDLDSDMANEQKAELEEHVPNDLHEIVSGRFSNIWNVEQVTALLKRSSQKKAEPNTPLKLTADSMKADPLPADLSALAVEMAEYTAEERASLKLMSGLGQDSDVVEAAIRTLIFLLPHVKNPHRPAPEQTTLAVFSGVVHQLEDLLAYLLLHKDYDLAALIVRALRMPADDPAFNPRLEEALRNIASPSTIKATLMELRTFTKNSAEYRSAYAYLTIFERETTSVLLELIAEESDRAVRVSLLDIVKTLGKNQIELLGEHITDRRWYVVRNVASILGESKDEAAIPYLQKAAFHNDVRIRQEVVKALISIGGKKAATIFSRFLEDSEPDMQLMAMRALGSCGNIGIEEARYLIAYLEDRPVRKKDETHIIEAIKALGKIGGNEAAEFLKRYERIRWWKPRAVQKEVRTAARAAASEIARRKPDGGRATR